ncbi:MAG: pantetheine-phosphate adenylyltransferase [Verrucomicrobiales bacterium]
MRVALYPGSFDPVTYGHLDVIQRASRLFDRVIVAVAHNDAKTPLFTPEERLELIRESCGEIPNLTFAHFEGLLVDYVRVTGAIAVVRGLRAISDFEFEFQMALMNRKLEPAAETIFLMPREEYSYLSSRMVREVARLGGDVAQFVPPAARTALLARLGRA